MEQQPVEREDSGKNALGAPKDAGKTTGTKDTKTAPASPVKGTGDKTPSAAAKTGTSA